MGLPENYINLAAAYSAPHGAFVNVIGLVVDIMQPVRTSAGQYMFTFKLLDISLYNSIDGSSGLAVRFFKPDAASLPQIRRLGDIVLLRRARMQPFNSRPMLLSNYETATLVFPSSGIPNPNFEIAFQGRERIECYGIPLHVQSLSLAEQAYVVELKQETKSIAENLPPAGANDASHTTINQPAFNPPTEPRAVTIARQNNESLASRGSKPSSFGYKFRLIKDVRHREFADICAQVVKKFYRNFRCDLYVTDYTENQDMFFYSPPEAESEDVDRDGDTYGYAGPQKRTWPGPYGQLVLKVNVMEPHAGFVDREINEGDIVLLRNVKVKFMPEGSKLEGDMWRDDRSPDKVNIAKLRFNAQPEVHALLERKDKYWAGRKRKASPPPKETKSAKKRKKKQAKVEATGDSTVSRESNDIKQKSKTGVNPHIRCSHEEVAITSIRDIRDAENRFHTNESPDGTSYELPFVNTNHRARVRCIDFAPKDIATFAVAVEDTEVLDDDSDLGHNENHDHASGHKYEWNFSLLLQDAQNSKLHDSLTEEGDNSLWVTIGHKEAQYLFGNGMSDPCDLTGNTHQLAQLRERLCILWGNLEEDQSKEAGGTVAGLSNRAFECCIAEYGVLSEDDDIMDHRQQLQKVSGWRRCYRMFGVTIL